MVEKIISIRSESDKVDKADVRSVAKMVYGKS